MPDLLCYYKFQTEWFTSLVFIQLKKKFSKFSKKPNRLEPKKPNRLEPILDTPLIYPKRYPKMLLDLFNSQTNKKVFFFPTAHLKFRIG